MTKTKYLAAIKLMNGKVKMLEFDNKFNRTSFINDLNIVYINIDYAVSEVKEC